MDLYTHFPIRLHGTVLQRHARNRRCYAIAKGAVLSDERILGFKEKHVQDHFVPH